jgi:penicillin-binding protein 1A
VVSPDIAHLVTAMLQKVVCCGTGTRANIGRPQAGKTGTNTLFRDAWFCGYVPQYSTAVWVGYPQGEISMYNVEGIGEMFGGTIPAEIWHDFMAQVTQKLPALSFPSAPAQQSGTVPKVVGLTQAAAESVLARAHFTPIAVQVPSAQPAGTVVSQGPPAGSHAVLGSPVRIGVSTGHATQALVPDVIGRREADAERAITAAGFRTNVVTVPTHVRAQDGVVIDQDPRGGERTNQGGTVSIAVGQYTKSGGGNGTGNGNNGNGNGNGHG